MKVAILGATSFLAGRCAAQLAQHGHQLIPFARRNPESHCRTLANAPVLPLDFETIGQSLVGEIMRCDAVINCVGAGVQPNRREATSSIWQANAFAPIALIEQLADAGYRGKLITFGSYFELGELNAAPHWTKRSSLRAVPRSRMPIAGQNEHSRAMLPIVMCAVSRFTTCIAS